MSIDRVKEERRKRNNAITEKIKNGLWVPPQMDVWQSWFPNRGKIKKIKNPLNIIR